MISHKIKDGVLTLIIPKTMSKYSKEVQDYLRSLIFSDVYFKEAKIKKV